MINAIDVIDLLPLELATALQCDPFFCDIPVVIAEKGNVIQEVKRLQAMTTVKDGKWGVAVVVLQLVADDNMPEVSFGPLTLHPSFQVIEIPTQNNSNSGTKKSARKVARKIRDVIKPLFLDGLVTQFVFEHNCIVPVMLDQQNMVAYQVTCHTEEADTEEISQVSRPMFSVDGDNNVVITCATEGAQIYYTTDDSFPAPPDKLEGSKALPYTNPITVPADGVMIRAAAWLPNDISSVGSPVNRSFFELEPTNP